jgi:predicted enzyme related to lactoylglutathione lyase
VKHSAIASTTQTRPSQCSSPTKDRRRHSLLQKVPEPKVSKNRMHLDIVTDEIEPEIERLQALGARRLHDDVRDVAGTRWVTFVDPEDNEFCVCTGVEW